MAFFAHDVHLLARFVFFFVMLPFLIYRFLQTTLPSAFSISENSVSLDGKVFVWKISEGSEGDDDPQITGKIVLALQILGEEDTKHPRVCWHSHKQVWINISFSCICFFVYTF